MGRLDGKVAIVTGAGSGEATARLMAREGASVVVADINVSEAERVAGDLGATVAAEVDVSDEESVVRMIDTALQSFGGVFSRASQLCARASAFVASPVVRLLAPATGWNADRRSPRASMQQ